MNRSPLGKKNLVVIKNTGLETWAQQLDWCRQWNGTLAAIHSFNEQKFVYELVKANASSCTDAWIGLHDKAGDHKWSWTDGTAYDYTYWELRKPANKGKPTCTRLQMAKDKGQWDDNDCQSRDVGAAVCQFTPHTEWEQHEPPATGGPTCPGGWELFEPAMKCFKVINNPNAAPYQHLFESACNAENGNLAAIHSRAENDFVTDLANRNRNLIGWSNITWIGLQNPQKRPGKWMWTDGSPYNYTYWETERGALRITMPDNQLGNQYCTLMKLRNEKENWDDSNCQVKTIVSAICQLIPGATSPGGNPIVSTPSTNCPDLDWDFYPRTGKCYKFVNGFPTNNKNFEDNKRLCAQNGGTLVSIHSQDENDYIMRLAETMTKDVAPGARNAFWIGLFQAGRTPTPWQWVDGSKYDFKKWDVGQPNNRFVNGAVINRFCGFLQFRKYRADVAPGTWDDASCVSPAAAYAVCQFIVTPVKGEDPDTGHTTTPKPNNVKPCILNARSYRDLDHSKDNIPTHPLGYRAQGPCPPGWSHFAGTNKCMVHTWCGGPEFPMFVTHLQLLCSGKGRASTKNRPDATMVSISSKAENDFVLDLVKHLAPCHRKIWIGLGAPHRPDNWKWLDNRTPFAYNNFAPRKGIYNAQQWNPDKYCAFMVINSTVGTTPVGKWEQGPCSGQKSVLSTVCQFPVVKPPNSPAAPDPNARLGARCARPARCPPGWTYYRGTHKCFYILPNNNKWPLMWTFEQMCQRQCGNLAEIHHVHENAFILNLARQKLFPKGVPNTPNLAHSLKASVWIGYRVAGTPADLKAHKFTWVDGSAQHYFNWCPGTAGRKEWYFRRQPDNNAGVETCAVMNLGSYCPGQWADFGCGGAAVQQVPGAVCQIRLSGNPPPLPPKKG